MDWPDGKVSLYAHIPFCRAACAYCDFFSEPIRGEAPMEAYLASLAREIERASSWISRAEGFRGWRTAYLGGGTPSALPRKALAGFLESFRAAAGGGPLEEWTVECNPESLDGELLRILGGAGVDRISLGIQSLEDPALARARRPSDARRAREAIDLVAGAWKGRASADLILGIPGQTEEGLVSDIRELVGAGFRHISLYCLSVEEGTPFAVERRARPSDFLSEDEEARIWGLLKEELSSLGLRRYEVSNFALPGEESLHNLSYWRMDPCLGSGCAAVSSLPLPGGKTLRIERGRDLDAYVRGWDRCPSEISTIGPADSIKERLLMGFRTAEGIDRSRFAARFGADPAEILGEAFSEATEKGILRADASSVSVAESALDFLDPFLVECFEAVDRSPIAARAAPNGV